MGTHEFCFSCFDVIFCIKGAMDHSFFGNGLKEFVMRDYCLVVDFLVVTEFEKEKL